MRYRKSTVCFMALCLVTFAMLFAAGCSETGRNIDPGDATTSSVIRPRDVKLLIDFPNQELFYRGKRGYFDSLNITGSAHTYPNEGLAVYKGGINEIIDPSFEGSGWLLGEGATIDTTSAAHGARSLLYTGDGKDRVIAELQQRVAVVSSETRTLSFDHNFIKREAGEIRISMIAFDAGGQELGSETRPLEFSAQGWQRTSGFIWDLPQGTASYIVRIVAAGFRGVCGLDGFMSEPKDFFTPYFDGDSDNCLWVGAATPQNFTGDPARPVSKRTLAGLIVLGVTVIFVLVAAVAFTAGLYHRRPRRYMYFLPLVTPVVLVAAIVLGVLPAPGFWPPKLIMQGSTLEPGRSYFYRVSSVDEAGLESPPSSEVRIVSGWMGRRIALRWDRDPYAVKYRVYRGDATYEQDIVFEVDGGLSSYDDIGLETGPGRPKLELGVNIATPHSSRSLRAEPDVSVSNTRIGLDTKYSFWVTGEVKFDFSSDHPFRPASFFEIGNPYDNTQFAVSTRYFPEWGDEYARIILIKGVGRGDFEAEHQPLPRIQPGSMIRYVAAQLYEATPQLPAGVHLWYRVDDGPVNYLTNADTQSLSSWPLIKISKRYYYDQFGNNSICRSFAIIQGTIEPGFVDGVMSPGTVPERVNDLTADSEYAHGEIQFGSP
ncbi:MAG: hypothetical protein ACYC51_04960 [Thermoleophilia bacterium]